MSPRSFHCIASHLIAFLVLLAEVSGCSTEQDAGAPAVGQQRSALVCSGYQDIVVTSNYDGAREEVVTIGDSALQSVSHAAALEVARGVSGDTIFAAGWIPRSGSSAQVALYRYTPAGFVSSLPLPYGMGSRRWIARAGHDSECGAVVPTASSCAWFAYNDGYGETTWTAVGDNGHTNSAWLNGFDGSGDIGIVYWGSYSLKRQLRAWISPDRHQVLAQIFDGLSSVGSPFVLRTMQTDFKADQTAVVWSERNQRWLVVWAENYTAQSIYWNGKVHSRWVGFDGSLQNSAQNLGYCEGNPTSSRCGGGGLRGQETFVTGRAVDAGAGAVDASSASVRPLATDKGDAGLDGDGGTRQNNACYCKGFFVAASRQWVTWPDLDAFRVHHYAWQSRVTGDGLLAERYCGGSGCASDLLPDCSLYCPMDRLPPTATSLGHAIYQMARKSFSTYGSHMSYSIAASPFGADQDVLHQSPTGTPQALRTTGELTATLATDDVWTSSTPARLRLTISDAGSGVCP